MPAFTVQLTRHYTFETHAEVEVIAASPGEALEIALTMADTDQVLKLDSHDGYPGTTFAQTRDADGRWVTGHDG